MYWKTSIYFCQSQSQKLLPPLLKQAIGSTNDCMTMLERDSRYSTKLYSSFPLQITTDYYRFDLCLTVINGNKLKSSFHIFDR